MQKRIYKKKHYAGGVILLILCTFITIWGVFNRFSVEQQPDDSLDNLVGLETAPSHTEVHEIMPGDEVMLGDEITPEHKVTPEHELTPEYEVVLEYGLMPEIPIIEYQIASSLPINSSNAILMRVEDGNVLFEKNSTEKIYPASMSKIMTAVVVLENLNDLNESIMLSEKMYSGIYKANASVAGYVAGEKVRAIDLLYGLMLPSGAECAIGLAEHVAGSESAFADLMNSKARELGMNDTHFTNSTGLHDAVHYSTAKDIAILLQYAIENDTFYKIITSASHTTPSTNKHKTGLTYYSTLFSNIDSADFDGGSILGGKTGYTDEAGRCLASLAEKDGELFILVTCGAPADTLHIKDAFAVYSAITMGDLNIPHEDNYTPASENAHIPVSENAHTPASENAHTSADENAHAPARDGRPPARNIQ